MDRITRLQEFLAQTPNDSFVRHALALEYAKKGDDEAARRFFEQVLAENENYIGSYYHLAKLLERSEKTAEAMAVYEKGMRKAKEAGDNHAYNELRSAYDELTID